MSASSASAPMSAPSSGGTASPLAAATWRGCGLIGIELAKQWRRPRAWVTLLTMAAIPAVKACPVRTK